MPYSRQNPSPRYTELLAAYQRMHREGLPDEGVASEDLYYGASLIKHLPTIRALAHAVGATSMLDYGSGKGRFYKMSDVPLKTGEIAASLQDYLGMDRIRCYDPAVAEHCTLPDEQFDLVISTDALEHCPEADMPWIVAEMFSFARKAVFANVASYPAKKTLPNGENAHATQRPVAWWKALLADISQSHPGVRYNFEIEHFDSSIRTLFRNRKRLTSVTG
jgi:hypothetical protein